MDYGHTMQSAAPTQEEPFFTAGVGTASEEVNNFEPENNLDTTNNQVSWGSTAEHDLRSIGSNTLNSTESSHNSPIMSAEITPTMPPMGVVTELEQPGLDVASSSASTEATFHPEESIKTGETLNKAGVRQMDGIIHQFTKSGDIARATDEYWKLVERNLKSSYNRAIGEDEPWAA